ncbi:hypothetical protein HYQ44_016352 [Verticillium longisporum]|nr:hypothetical protein HYQ44_016352 [Verticillium longisporum]
MPIGDLLASISGDSSRPSSTPQLPRANSNLKRKADEELRPAASKTPRTTPDIIQVQRFCQARQWSFSVDERLGSTNKRHITTRRPTTTAEYRYQGPA